MRLGKLQNRTEMMLITLIVVLFMIVMLVLTADLNRKLEEGDKRIKYLKQEIEEEAAREAEIEEFKEYTHSDEYIKEYARGTLGLVNDKEIVFKEVRRR